MRQVLSLLLTFGLLLVSNSSFSSIYYGWNGQVFGPTPQATCQLHADQFTGEQATCENLHPRPFYDNNYLFDVWRNYPSRSQAEGDQVIYPIEGACPASYIDDGSGNCIIPQSCPSGQVNIGSESVPNCVDICVSGQTSTVITALSSIPNEIITSSGCSALYDSSTKLNCKLSDPVYCTVTYTESDIFHEDNPCTGSSLLNCYTVVYGDSNTATPQVADTGTPIPNPETTETKTVAPTITAPIDDGTSTTNSETNTKTSDIGTTIKQIGDTVVRVDASGTIIEIISQLTVNTYTDGTSTSIEQNTVNSSPSNNSNTTYNVVDNTITTTSTTSGPSGTKTTSITNHYDSAGKLISQDSQTSGTGLVSGTGTGQDDETKEGNCGAPGQPVCDVKLVDTSDEYVSTMQKIQDAMDKIDSDNKAITDNFTQNVDDAFDNLTVLNPANFLSKYFGFSMPSSCTGSINTTVFDRAFVVDPCEKLQPLRDILAWTFFVLTLMLSTKILFSRSLL